MARGKIIATGIAAALASGSALAAAPRVMLEISARAPIGDSYEKLTGIAHLEIDPADAANRGIVDLDLAPRDARGLVRYDVDLQILRPRDPARARRIMLYDVVNRGMKVISVLTGKAGGGEADMLMRQGFTVVWSGWQGDIADPALIGARFPTVSGADGPVTGRIATDTVFDDLTTRSIHLPYPAATLDQSDARLTVRQRSDDAERPVPADHWRYNDARAVTVDRPADMDAGAIYRFSYVARDPRVMGLGFAAVRDLVAFLRHGSAADGNVLADIAFDSSIGVGISQSGRYLRDFLWQGFNRDLAGRRVFDGVIPLIPGGRRTFTNVRFAEPGRFSRQHEDHDVPGFDFPFAYSTLRDPATGRTDGILARCEADGTCPKIFHIDTSGEFWQAGASLVGTGGTDRDIAFPANVRAYMIAGGAHAIGMALPFCQSPANTLDYTPLVRSLVVAMVDWVDSGKAPPPSRWPRLDKGELRALDDLQTPDLTPIGMAWPRVLNRPIAPPRTKGWPVQVPIVDSDGNDLPGIRLPQIAVPTATHLPWNIRAKGHAPGDLCFVFGADLLFAKDAASRGADPRRSLAERYPGDSRAIRVRESVEALRRDRFLLDADADAMLAGDRAAPRSYAPPPQK